MVEHLNVARLDDVFHRGFPLLGEALLAFVLLAVEGEGVVEVGERAPGDSRQGNLNHRSQPQNTRNTRNKSTYEKRWSSLSPIAQASPPSMNFPCVPCIPWFSEHGYLEMPGEMRMQRKARRQQTATASHASPFGASVVAWPAVSSGLLPAVCCSLLAACG